MRLIMKQVQADLTSRFHLATPRLVHHLPIDSREGPAT